MHTENRDIARLWSRRPWRKRGAALRSSRVRPGRLNGTIIHIAR